MWGIDRLFHSKLQDALVHPTISMAVLPYVWVDGIDGLGFKMEDMAGSVDNGAGISTFSMEDVAT